MTANDVHPMPASCPLHRLSLTGGLRSVRSPYARGGPESRKIARTKWTTNANARPSRRLRPEPMFPRPLAMPRQPATTLGAADIEQLVERRIVDLRGERAGDVECAGFSETSSVDGGPQEELADPPARGDRLQLVDPWPGGSGARCSTATAQRASSPYASIQRYVSGRRRHSFGASTSSSSARGRSPRAAATSPSPLRAMLSQHGSPTWQPRANACSKRASAEATSPRMRSTSARNDSGHGTNAVMPRASTSRGPRRGDGPRPRSPPAGGESGPAG